ncbi:MAG: hypothetical protein ACI35T_05985 [Alistipes sp.]
MLGKRQNKLQEQQLKLQEEQNKLQQRQIEAQEYEIYRNIFIQADNIEMFARTFIQHITLGFYNSPASNERINIIDDIIRECRDLNDGLIKCSFDIELKLGKNDQNVFLYSGVLQEIKQIVLHIRHLIEGNQTTFINSFFASLNIDLITDPKALIDNFIECCKYDDDKKELRTMLLGYLDVLDKIKTDNLKEIIQQRITPNYEK